MLSVSCYPWFVHSFFYSFLKFKTDKITRLQFLRSLGKDKELMRENVQNRATIPAVRILVKTI